MRSRLTARLLAQAPGIDRLPPRVSRRLVAVAASRVASSSKLAKSIQFLFRWQRAPLVRRRRTPTLFLFVRLRFRLSPTPPPIRVFCVRGRTKGKDGSREGICFWVREAEVVANECEVGSESAARGCVGLSEFREGGCERVLAVFARNVEFPKNRRDSGYVLREVKRAS